MQTRDSIEFWFDFGSNYSYLSVMRIAPLAAAAGVRVVLKPFLLGPIFKSLGWDNSPFVLQQMKGAYMWQDMVRQCDKYGLRWQRPASFPRNGLLAARVALAGEGAAWLAPFCQQVMLANFADDREIGHPAVIGAILDDLGADSAALLERAGGEDIKTTLRERTAAAQARGIFGAPMFFAGDAMFWGNDRLDDAIAHATTQRQEQRA
ncbi:MAG: 2-hydroxychromene-2-carboxylate isomerase [Massilia sp.]